MYPYFKYISVAVQSLNLDLYSLNLASVNCLASIFPAKNLFKGDVPVVLKQPPSNASAANLSKSSANSNNFSSELLVILTLTILACSTSNNAILIFIKIAGNGKSISSGLLVTTLGK